MQKGTDIYLQIAREGAREIAGETDSQIDRQHMSGLGYAHECVSAQIPVQPIKQARRHDSLAERSKAVAQGAIP